MRTSPLHGEFKQLLIGSKIGGLRLFAHMHCTGNLGNLVLGPLVGFNACADSYHLDQLTSGERARASDTWKFNMTGTGGTPGYATVFATQPVISGKTVHLQRGGVVATVISNSNVSTGVSVP